MCYNEDIDPPTPHDISNVFAAADLSSQSSYDSVKYKRAMHVYIYLNQIMNKMISLPLQTHSKYPVVVEDLDLHYKPSLSLY